MLVYACVLWVSICKRFIIRRLVLNTNYVDVQLFNSPTNTWFINQHNGDIAWSIIAYVIVDQRYLVISGCVDKLNTLYCQLYNNVFIVI